MEQLIEQVMDTMTKAGLVKEERDRFLKKDNISAKNG